MKIKSKLFLGYLATTFVLFSIVVLIQWQVYKVDAVTQKIAELRAPSSAASARMLSNIHASLANLRGYLLTTDPSFQLARSVVWSDIDATRGRLNQLSKNWTEPKNIRLWVEFKEILHRFRIAQDKVENIARSKDQRSANNQQHDVVMPLTAKLLGNLTWLIRQEADQAASPRRRELLVLMSQLQGALSLGQAELYDSLASDEQAMRRYSQHSQKAQAYLEQLQDHPDLSNSQLSLVSELGLNFTRLKIEVEVLHELHRSGQNNLANLVLVTEAMPAARLLLEKLVGLESSGEYSGGITHNQILLLDNDAQHSIALTGELILILNACLLALFLISLATYTFFSRQVIKPLLTLINIMDRLAENHAGFEILYLERKDEIGKMARAIAVFKGQRDGIEQLVESTRHAQEKSQQALIQVKASSSRAQAVIKSMNDAVITIDDKGIIKDFSHSAEVVFGYNCDQAIGHNISMLIAGDHRQNHDGYISKYLQGSKAGVIGYVRELFARHADGRDFPIELRVSEAWTGEDGKFFTGIVRDITLRKKAEEQLHKARDDAKKASKAKSNFLASMSHEIRTPLNGIIGMIDMIERTVLTQDQRHMASTIHKSSSSLLTIINEILDFSKIEAGKLEISKASTSLSQIVQDIGSTLGTLAHDKSLRFFLYIDPNIPDQLELDANRVHQILLNLVGNALKFTSSTQYKTGRVVLRVDIKERDDEGNKLWLKFSVIDNGIGITEPALQSLFQPFSQADSSTTRSFGGTGLGLVICKKLCEMMDGRILVNSVYGEGSTFSIELPCEVAQQPEPSSELKSVAGLRTVVFSNDYEHGEFIKRHLEAYSVDVILLKSHIELEDFIDAKHLTVGNDIKVDAVIIDDEWTSASKLRAIEPTIAYLYENKIGCLLTRDAWSELSPELCDKCTVLRDFPLTAEFLCNGLAITMGFISPDVTYAHELKHTDAVHVPSIEEAESRGLLVLLAEDNLINQDVIKMQLNQLGYALLIAADGQEALDLFKNRRFGMVLSDIHMPIMDGYQFVEKLRQLETDRNQDRTPVLAITAAALKDQLDKCYTVGMDGYITKPLKLITLSRTMKQWLPLKPESRPQLTSIDKPSEGALGEKQSDTELGFDPTMLQQVIGNDPAKIAKAIESFLSVTQAMFESFDQHYADKNKDPYASMAHQLKSAARALGANALANLCLKLEASVTIGDWKRVEVLHAQLRPCFDTAKDELQKLSAMTEG